MKFVTASLVLLASATSALAKNILMSNDDGWASTNLRAFYYKLKESGHNVYIVSPVSQRSGNGGKFDIPTSPALQTDGEFGYPPAGSPTFGHEVDDDHIFYFNGTPASCVAFGLDYIIPKYANNITIDLVVAGINEGVNTGSLYSLSGTMGATYTAVYRGYPAISFSASGFNNSFFKDNLDLDDTLLESTIVATKSAELVDQLFMSQDENTRALALGVGLNVNFPPLGYDNESCTDPTWAFARMSGMDAIGADIQYDEETQKYSWVSRSWDALTACYNGDCSLPSENYVLEQGNCQATVSVFSIDYDANLVLTQQAKALLDPLFQ
ncbi:Acid phosphatase [Candida viswanathii]|uniref:Acid phosphatase n=1 Tax=Candida viswanathii TaxID=5486 RepID=A0A367YDQ8_9ASCO|nr:Acid phosphatase [Candida viswanathii]